MAVLPVGFGWMDVGSGDECWLGHRGVTFLSVLVLFELKTPFLQIGGDQGPKALLLADVRQIDAGHHRWRDLVTVDIGHEIGFADLAAEKVEELSQATFLDLFDDQLRRLLLKEVGDRNLFVAGAPENRLVAEDMDVPMVVAANDGIGFSRVALLTAARLERMNLNVLEGPLLKGVVFVTNSTVTFVEVGMVGLRPAALGEAVVEQVDRDVSDGLTGSPQIDPGENVDFTKAVIESL